MLLYASTMCASGMLFAVVVFAAPWTVDGSKRVCPDIVQGSRHYARVHNGTCYLFVNKELYWSDAHHSCLNMGGEMLTVQDYRTMVFIRSVLNSRSLGWRKQGVWLGAKYTGGRWKWTTGEQVGYANWASGEPSKILGLFSVEDCALMRRSDNWRWHDYICGEMNYHFNYICQFPAEKYVTTTTTTTTSTTITTSAQSTTGVDGVIKSGYFIRKGQHVSDRPDKTGDGTGDYGVLDYNGENRVPSHPYDTQNGVPRYPSKHYPGLTDRGYNEVQSTSHPHDNGNLTLLTIILALGGIVIIILLLIFLIVRKRYNYKKAIAQPTVHFENRNYNHTHSGSGNSQPLPPPPAPHTFHRPTAPPIPPRPLETLLSYPPPPVTHVSPHVRTPYMSHSRPASDLYLTPVELAEGLYEEIQAPKLAKDNAEGSLTSAPLHSNNLSGVCGGTSQLEEENTPLISASGGAALWGASEESLHSMSGSLTQKSSSIHNDYVDMNGSPVVKAGRSREAEPTSATSDDKEADPKNELPMDDGYSQMSIQQEGKTVFNPNYSNLMTTSQERCENLYAQLH